MLLRKPSVNQRRPKPMGKAWIDISLRFDTTILPYLLQYQAPVSGGVPAADLEVSFWHFRVIRERNGVGQWT